MAGALTLDKLTAVLVNAGFVDIDIETKEVSAEYAAKWGAKDIDLQPYLRNSTITAYKAL